MRIEKPLSCARAAIFILFVPLLEYILSNCIAADENCMHHQLETAQVIICF